MFYTIQFRLCKRRFDSREHYMLHRQLSIPPQERLLGAQYYSYSLNKSTFTFLKTIMIPI